MLGKVVKSNLKLLTLGARDHAMMLRHDHALCQKVFESTDHCCHVCGVRTPGGLEIDHTEGHLPGIRQGLKPICQFCHDLKHPVWAASRGRIVPIWAPDVSQTDLTRLSWALVCWRETHPDKAEILRQDLSARAERFSDSMGCASAESLLEAAFAVLDALGPKSAEPALEKVDQVLRFAPSEALVEPASLRDTEIDQAGRLSTWTIGGFRKVARMVSKQMLEDHDPGANQVIAG